MLTLTGFFLFVFSPSVSFQCWLSYRVSFSFFLPVSVFSADSLTVFLFFSSPSVSFQCWLSYRVSFFSFLPVSVFSADSLTVFFLFLFSSSVSFQCWLSYRFFCFVFLPVSVFSADSLTVFLFLLLPVSVFSADSLTVFLFLFFSQCQFSVLTLLPCFFFFSSPSVSFQCWLSYRVSFSFFLPVSVFSADSLTVLVHPTYAIASVNICVHDNNPEHWQPYHCSDTKILHTLVGIGSAALADAEVLTREFLTRDKWSIMEEIKT